MLKTSRTLLIGVLTVAMAGGIVATGQPQLAHADAQPQILPSPQQLPQILPSPQQETAGGVSFPLTGAVTVVVGAKTDPSAEQLLTKTISAAGGTAKLVTSAPDGDAVYLGTTGDNPAMAGVLAGINLDGTTGIKPEGYVLGSGTVNGHNVLALDGLDASGTYYAVQTLRQIVKGGAVPAVTVRDWPQMSIRGEIEGFYGIPWSHQARMDMMAFDGVHKMNTYIYTPKDDPYLRSQWRDLYPQAQLAQLQELVGAANANHVNFTYALSPGNDICYSAQADLQATETKFDQLRSIGVTSFYIALDDIDTSAHCTADSTQFTTGGSYDVAKAQTFYLNELVNGYITPNHLQPLQTVPTQYNGSGASAYKTTFGTTLDPSVRVQWTGEGVFSDQITLASVTAAAQNYHTNHLYIWDNLPVNDGQRGRLFLNPLTGRDPQLYTKIDGITSNPMIEAYASMIALAGYGDYTWNSPKYDASVTQAAIIDELAGADPAMQNSLSAFVDLNQSWTPYRASSQHAPELSADIDAFWTAYQAGDAAGMKPLEDRLATIAAAPEKLKSMAQPGFYRDAQPWIVAAAHWATALQEEVASLTAIQSRQGETATKSALAALGEVTAAKQATVPDLGNNGQVVANSIVPSVGDGVFQTFSDKAVAAYNTWLGATPVGGFTPYTGTASTSMGTYASNSPTNMTDANLSTSYWSNQAPAVGDYVQVDLAAVKSVGSVAIHQADSDTSAGDMLYHADLQYSTNGTDWTTAAHFDNAPLVSYSFPATVQARYVRLAATGVNPGGKWVKIREFQVSPSYGVTATASTNLGQYQNYAPSNMADGNLSTFYWSNRTPAVGDSVQSDLGAVKGVGSVAVHQGDADTTAGDMLYHADLQYSTNGTDWTTAAHFDNMPLVSYSFPSPVQARYVRLTATDVNPGGKWVKVREFQVSPGSVLVTTDVPAAGASNVLNAFDASIQTAFTAASVPNKGATLTRAFTASTHLGSITLVGSAAGTLQYQDADGWHDLGTLDSSKVFQEAKVDKDGVEAVRIVFSGGGNVVPTIDELVTRDGGPIAKDPLIGSNPLATDTSIAVNGQDTGRTFDGIGAISGGGGNTRLLTDYPPAQQNAILDYLFKPGYGANLQILKIETSGDGNTTSGAEQTIEETKGVINCNAGYEFWLAKEAVQRNPKIKLYGLTWAAPGWVGSSMYSQNGIQYITDWLGCAKQRGLTIDYMGGWNEKAGWTAGWWKDLRAALDQHGFAATKLVAADQGSSFADVSGAMSQDSDFAKAISVIGEHYPCGWNGPTPISQYPNVETSCPSSQAAQALNTPLWASEQGSMSYNAGGLPMARANNIDYVDGRMTASINWPLVASAYTDVGFADQGLVMANAPWSGHYDVGLSTWVTAQTTQFAQPGWQYLDGASGHLAGQTSDQSGSYVTLKSPNGKDWSSVVETTRATGPQTVKLTVGGGLSTKPVRVWSTNLVSGDSSQWFVQGKTLRPDANGSVTMALQPNYIYTFTTTTGQHKGGAVSPASKPLSLPYSDSFDTGTPGQQARYLATMEGAFTIAKCAGRSGKCVQLETPAKPLEWQDSIQTPYPYTVGGGQAWSNYQVSADVRNAQPGSVGILGRQSNLGGTQEDPSKVHYYSLTLSDTGAWSINLADGSGKAAAPLTGGTIAKGAGLNTWHNLALTFDGSQIFASVDGTTVGSATDTTLSAGKIGLVASGYLAGEQFDNLTVRALTDLAVPVSLPAGAHTPGTATIISYSTTGSAVNQWQYSGAWQSGGGNTWDNTVGDTATLTFHGDSVTLQSMANASNGIVNVSVDGDSPTAVDIYSASGGLTSVFTRTGLDLAKQHTLVVAATGKKNPASSGTWASVAGAIVTVPGQPAPTPAMTTPADQSTIHPGSLRIEGTAPAGELITVSVSGAPACVNLPANPDGNWSCKTHVGHGESVITAVGVDPVTGLLSEPTAPVHVATRG
ncbi:beta-N-acetylglucosaminidase domain-containing protein [Arthrobacter dokdonensis]|uniref:beta-N-acetylglucosaminidase domain-containing protein n=1 Tax=Arthrobacter dokdonellae TaxID=2211210 RepID=UPI000DE5A47D|nr:beta-N-acetylglucosaminidase domain-containing protein [Arthrobacter dokdonellae]